MERIPSDFGSQLEEHIESRGSNDDYAICRERMKRHRFAALLFVPDEQPIGPAVEAPFSTEVVPAEKQHGHRDREPPRAGDQIRLRQSEMDHR
jgi:hypothetical protein